MSAVGLRWSHAVGGNRSRGQRRLERDARGIHGIAVVLGSVARSDGICAPHNLRKAPTPIRLLAKHIDVFSVEWNLLTGYLEHHPDGTSHTREKPCAFNSLDPYRHLFDRGEVVQP